MSFGKGTPTLHRVGRAGHGRHGGEASALCVGTDDVGLDSLALSHQGERANKPLLSKRNRPKPPRPSAIRLILLTEILSKPLLLAAYLQ